MLDFYQKVRQVIAFQSCSVVLNFGISDVSQFAFALEGWKGTLPPLVLSLWPVLHVYSDCRLTLLLEKCTLLVYDRYMVLICFMHCIIIGFIDSRYVGFWTRWLSRWCKTNQILNKQHKFISRSHIKLHLEHNYNLDRTLLVNTERWQKTSKKIYIVFRKSQSIVTKTRCGLLFTTRYMM